MTNKTVVLALDVGEKRIGVAIADSAIKIAIPLQTIDVDGTEIDQINQILGAESADIIVVGYPRNQSGEVTAQTEYVEEFAKKLVELGKKIDFQDESLTSVAAEQRLKAYGGKYEKGDIDSMAASIILQDYMEQNYAR